MVAKFLSVRFPVAVMATGALIVFSHQGKQNSKKEV